MANIAVINNWGNYDYPFNEWAHTYNVNTREELVDNLNDLDCVVFTGGTDINPSIYGEVPHPATSRPDIKRDKEEVSIFELCTSWGIPMIGICRGAQLLCALNGGKLHQDVRGHTREHKMFTNKRSMWVSSTHHQMMKPNYHGIVLGWANQGVLPDESPEPEVVWWPGSCSLGVQYHPEYLSSEEEAFKYFVSLAKALLNEEKLENV
jgi:putative glutamine amidotransferase